MRESKFMPAGMDAFCCSLKPLKFKVRIPDKKDIKFIFDALDLLWRIPPDYQPPTKKLAEKLTIIRNALEKMPLFMQKIQTWKYLNAISMELKEETFYAFKSVIDNIDRNLFPFTSEYNIYFFIFERLSNNLEFAQLTASTCPYDAQGVARAFYIPSHWDVKINLEEIKEKENFFYEPYEVKEQ